MFAFKYGDEPCEFIDEVDMLTGPITPVLAVMDPELLTEKLTGDPRVMLEPALIAPIITALFAVTFPPAVTLKLLLVIAPVFEIVRFGVSRELALIVPLIEVFANSANPADVIAHPDVPFAVITPLDAMVPL